MGSHIQPFHQSDANKFPHYEFIIWIHYSLCQMAAFRLLHNITIMEYQKFRHVFTLKLFLPQ